MNLFEAVILGLIQGLTEFLPVSSSGHLELAKSLFGTDPEMSFFFTVAVHGATVLSTIAVFYKEIGTLISGVMKFRMNDETLYVLKIVVSMIPVGITGLFFKDQVEALFSGNLFFIGSMLLITSLILALAHFKPSGSRNIGFADAFIIGIAQAIAVIPGISRSGATIATGLMIGNSRDVVARFSFLMVLIPVIGANLLELKDGMTSAGDTGLIIISAGFVSAFISGYLACRWMISIVRRSRLIWFAIYCTAVGLSAIFLN